MYAVHCNQCADTASAVGKLRHCSDTARERATNIAHSQRQL